MSQYTTVSMMIEQGYTPLTGEQIHQRIINKTTWGDYLMGYRFITYFDENGQSEGTNNVGSFNAGHWAINYEDNTLYAQWNRGWAETTVQAYDVNGEIHFFDCETGNWRMAITHSNDEKIAIEVENIILGDTKGLSG